MDPTVESQSWEDWTSSNSNLISNIIIIQLSQPIPRLLLFYNDSLVLGRSMILKSVIRVLDDGQTPWTQGPGAAIDYGGVFRNRQSKNHLWPRYKIKSRNRLNASIKLQQETQTRAGRRIRAQRTRNNKQKRPALLSLERRDHGQKAKVAKQSFHENCLSNVASYHLKRGSLESANRAVEENTRITVRPYCR